MMSDATPEKPLTKSQVLTALTEATGLEKQQVIAVLDALAAEIKASLAEDGPGSFALAGLMKIQKKEVPARPAKTGVPNPFKPGELMDVAAKPASKKVTVRPLKSLKDMVADDE